MRLSFVSFLCVRVCVCVCNTRAPCLASPDACCEDAFQSWLVDLERFHEERLLQASLTMSAAIGVQVWRFLILFPLFVCSLLYLSLPSWCAK